MARRLDHLVARTALDDVAGVHHGHGVAGLADDGEVVGDEDDRHPGLLLQLDEEGEDLLLHGDVDRRRRLVGEQQLGTGGNGHRDHHPLAHATGKLVRVVPRPLGGRGDADGAQEIDGALGRLLVGEAEPDAQHLGKLRADRVDRVEGGARVLEDHRDLAPAHGLHADRPRSDDAAALPNHLAGEDLAGLGHHVHDRPQGHALSATGLADDAERLRRREGEVDVVGSEQDAALGREPDRQLAHLEQAGALPAGGAHLLLRRHLHRSRRATVLRR